MAARQAIEARGWVLDRSRKVAETQARWLLPLTDPACCSAPEKNCRHFFCRL
jgi:hypothetical protein